MSRKIKLCLIMLVSILVFYSTTYVLAYDVWYIDRNTGEITVNSTPAPQIPNVRLFGPTSVTQQAGTKEQHELTIRNIGSGGANNLFVTMEAEKDAPFTVSFVNNSQWVSSLGNGSSKKIDIEIITDENVKSGSYTLTLSYAYIDRDNKEYSSSDKITVKINGTSASSSSLLITNLNVNKDSISQVTEFVLSGQIKNNANTDVRDVQLVITGFETSGINLSNSPNTIDVSSIGAGKSHSFNLNLYTSSKIKSGAYPLKFKLIYKDADGTTHTNEETQYYISVSSGEVEDESKAILEITRIEAPSADIAVAQNFTQTLHITNNGDKTAKNVKITASTDTTMIVPKSASIQLISSIEPGETKTLGFTFSPTSKAQSQSYNIAYSVNYQTGYIKDDDTVETLTFEQFAGVNVTNPEDDETGDTSVPKIIISKYSSDPVIVQAGREFDLHLTFLNSHATKTVKNIEISLTVEDKTEDKGIVFTPVNSSNSFFIDSINPGQELDRTLRLYTVPDALPKNYQIRVNMEYDDNEGDSHTFTKIIGINVTQISRLETSEIYIPEFGTANQPVYISFMMYNMGKVKLSNLQVKMEGEFDTTGAENFYGTFDVGYTEYFDGFFMPRTGGQQAGKLILSYEDDIGTAHEIVKEFSIFVSEPYIDEGMMGGGMDRFPPEGMEQPAEQTLAAKALALLKNKYVWIGVGVVVAIVVIVVVRVIKVRKRKEWELDE